MKYLISLFLFSIAIQVAWSQKSEKRTFYYTSTGIAKVVSDIEKKFDVKYSYVDSILTAKQFSLPKALYSLDEMNRQLEVQTALKIVKIDDRFYSILQEKKKENLLAYTLNDVLVEGFLARGINKTAQKVILYPQKVETLPGVTDADILLTLQQLPGVKSPNETASGLYVRGSTPDQNLILWDGIRLYHPGHLFGMISAINPNVQQTVNYYNKATNPRFGERISSVIEIRTTDEIATKTKANAGLNSLNADAYFQTPLIKNKLGLQVSGRKSITEWMQAPSFNQLAKKVFQNTNFRDFNDQNQFKFQDYAAKLNFKPNDHSEFSLTGLWITNDLNFKSEGKDSSIDHQSLMISNYGFSLNWAQHYSSRFRQKTLVFYSAYDFDYEKKQTAPSATYEGYKKLNRVIDSGVELNFCYALSKKINVDFGYQLFGNDVSHLFNNYNQNISVVLDRKQNYTITHAGYSFFKYDEGRWSLQAGTRYNYYSKVKATSFEPRALVQRKLSDELVWQISYERKSQISSQIREDFANDLSLENYVWVLSGKKGYPVQRANQFTTGFIFKKEAWLLDIDGYYKTIKGITSFTFDFQNQYDLNIHTGSGFTKGVDVLLQKNAATWRAWATYTFEDSQNKFDEINQNRYFKTSSSIQHSVHLSFYKKWNAYTLALGWFWHTGKPYSLLDSSGQLMSYNSATLPDYHRLDISGFYQFKDHKEWNYKIGFSIYNLYNHHEIISKELERKFTDVTDFITPRYSVQDYFSLGITPNVFIRVGF